MNYKKMTIFIVVLGLGLYWVLSFYSQSKILNYIFVDQTEIERKHQFFNEQLNEKFKLVLLGSSSVAGNNIPPNTTIADYLNQGEFNFKAYNLAAMEASILDVNILFDKIKNQAVDLVVLGIEPTILNLNSRAKIFKSNYKKLSIEDKNYYMNFYKHYYLMDSLDIFQRDSDPPNKLQIWWKTYLHEKRIQFFGQLFDVKILGGGEKKIQISSFDQKTSWDLLEHLLKNSKDKKIKVAIFIEPVLEGAFDKKEYELFVKKVKDVSKNDEAIFLDYSNLLPSTHDYFYDFVHLTPLGNKTLATRLKEDLKKNNDIRGVR